MILLYTVEARGLEPAPWKVPNIGVDRRNGGKQRFARRPGKSNIGGGRVCMVDWEAFVKDAARLAVNRRPIETGIIALHFEFFGETPPGKRNGSIWDVDFEFHAKRNVFVKHQRFGRGEADLTNLQKSTEDALEGVVFVNDCQVREVNVRMTFSLVPGVTIKVYRIEPTDYPGEGDPIPE